MKKIILLLVLSLSLFSCYQIKSRKLNKQAQELAEKQKETAEKYSDNEPTIFTYEQTQDSSTVFTLVEKMPEYPGGMDSLMAHLSRTISYPSEAKEANIQGKVYVQFIVEKDGSLSDIQIIRGIGGGCDEEAINAVTSMTKWSPGEFRGKKVRVRFILPVNFVLRETNKKKKKRNKN